MMRIMNRRRTETTVEFCLRYDDQEAPGSGFTFSCDEHGVVSQLRPAAQANYERCQREPDRFVRRGVEKYEHSYTHPAVGLCDCGHRVSLGGFTNSCEGCGADYNRSGQRLASREQWGEETDESLSDILAIP